MSSTLVFLADTFGTQPGQNANNWFATPWLGFIDTVRIVLIILFGIYAGRVFYAFYAKWMPDFWRRVMIIGVLIAGWSMVETEWDRLGLGVGSGGRLWLNAIAIILFFVGTFKMLSPQKTRSNKARTEQENTDPLNLS